MSELWRTHAAWLLAGALATCWGCSNEDTEHLIQVGKVTAAKVEALAGNEKLLSGWQSVRGDLSEPGLDARVAARLRWDKALGDARIDVQVRDGRVELRGVVGDPAQRRRAVELAEATAGAATVIDFLEMK